MRYDSIASFGDRGRKSGEAGCLYQEVFELDQIGQVAGAVFLSDGTFNLALLPVRDGMETGLRGVGFETARLDSIRMKLGWTIEGDQYLVERDAPSGIEHEMRDPEGNGIDISQKGWHV